MTNMQHVPPPPQDVQPLPAPPTKARNAEDTWAAVRAVLKGAATAWLLIYMGAPWWIVILLTVMFGGSEYVKDTCPYCRRRLRIEQTICHKCGREHPRYADKR